MKAICLIIALCLLCQTTVYADICSVTATTFAASGIPWAFLVLFSSDPTTMPPRLQQFENNMLWIMLLSAGIGYAYGCDWVKDLKDAFIWHPSDAPLPLQDDCECQTH
jgi:hypothetical protein